MAGFSGRRLRTDAGGRLWRSSCIIRRLFVSKPFFSDLSKDEVDVILRRNERTVFVGEGAVHSFDSNQLPANSPCEDHCAFAKCRTTGSWFFGVFDGHGGSQCSRAVSRRLFDYDAVCLQPLHRQKELAESMGIEANLLEWFSSNFLDQEWNNIFLSSHLANLRRFASYCVEKHEALANVRTAMQTAFLALDNDLSENVSQSPASLPHLALVASGSCACVAKIRGPNLYLANAGDSAAVLGVCNEQGVWTARQITHEHTIDNADEVKRIRSEHPAKEATTILKAGRLLGQLFPLRAFGDVRFKWTANRLRDVLEKHLGVKVVPEGLHTPPYLTAKPEVYYHRLTANDKFLVIGSDGLWETLSPDQVVRLVSDHMIGRVTLSPYAVPEGANVGQVLHELRLRKRGESKKPLDVNAATHLIRYAVGGSGNGSHQYVKLASLLGLSQGAARNYHDDITIIVVYFDSSYLAQDDIDQPVYD